MKQVRTPPEGCEWRGFKFRVYSTDDQIATIREHQSELVRIWNALVSEANRVYHIRDVAAVREGIVGPCPERPNYDGLGPEEAHAARLEHRRVCSSRRALIKKWADKQPSLSYRNRKESKQHFGVRWDYDWCRAVAGVENPVTGANVRAALVKDYDSALSATKRGQRPPQIKKGKYDIGIRTRATDGYITFGQFGTRPGCPNGRSDWLNVQVRLPKIPLLLGRVGPEQAALLSEDRLWGVSLREEPDGWYASVRHAQPVKEIPPYKPGLSCGIDMGLIDLAAVVKSDGETFKIENPRHALRHANRIAERQAAELPVGKLHCRAARNVRQIVREQLFPVVEGCEYIFAEHLSFRVGQLGSAHVSFMKTAIRMLQDRFGDRVREVDCCYTSQDCSQCGHRSKESWSYAHGRVGKCQVCGYSEHRDLNAARNVLRKGLKLLEDS